MDAVNITETCQFLPDYVAQHSYLSLWERETSSVLEIIKNPLSLMPYQSKVHFIYLSFMRNPNNNFSIFKKKISLSLTFVVTVQGGIPCSHLMHLINCTFGSFKISNNFKFRFQSGDYSWAFRFLIDFADMGTVLQK